jgi:hypothetical protein
LFQRLPPGFIEMAGLIKVEMVFYKGGGFTKLEAFPFEVMLHF